MKDYRQYIFILFAAWFVFAQNHALEHAIEHEAEGHDELCSICLDAAQFSSLDTATVQIAYIPRQKVKSAVSFEVASYAGLFATHYASRAPPTISL